MPWGRDLGHGVIVVYFCENNHKTGAGGVGFVRVLLGGWE